MAETQATTYAIQQLLGKVSSLKTVAFIDQTETYPYTLTESNVTSFACVNQHITDTLVLEITLESTAIFTVSIPKSTTYQAEYESPIASINTPSVAPTFQIELLRRSL